MELSLFFLGVNKSHCNPSKYVPHIRLSVTCAVAFITMKSGIFYRSVPLIQDILKVEAKCSVLYESKNAVGIRKRSSWAFAVNIMFNPELEELNVIEIGKRSCRERVSQSSNSWEFTFYYKNTKGLVLIRFYISDKSRHSFKDNGERQWD